MAALQDVFGEFHLTASFRKRAQQAVAGQPGVGVPGGDAWRTGQGVCVTAPICRLFSQVRLSAQCDAEHQKNAVGGAGAADSRTKEQGR